MENINFTELGFTGRRWMKVTQDRIQWNDSKVEMLNRQVLFVENKPHAAVMNQTKQ